MGPPIDPAAPLLIVAGAALFAGLTSSLHCFGMCGPLACAGTAAAPRRSRAIVAYQVARTVTYTTLGALLGAIGGQVLDAAALHPPSWIAWVTAGLLVLSALGLGAHVPQVPGATQLVQLGARAGARVAPAARAGLLGIVTPFLPCGLAYGVFATSLVAGGAGVGAIVAGGFALGGVPALMLAQLQADWLHRLPKGSVFVVRRVLPLAAAVLLVWRALQVQATGSCCE